MTIKHVAWLQFRDDISAERVEDHMTACRSLPAQIPALVSLECGASFSDRSGKFTHCIIVTVASRDALAEYLNHPAHVPVGNNLKADLADLKVMDLEV